MFTNIGAILAIKISLGEKIDIVWKINPNLLIYGLLLYIIITIGVAYTFKVLFDISETKVYYFSSVLGIIFGLGSTFLTSIKSILNVIIYEKDIIFENKLFSIRYIYDEMELRNLIDSYYIKYHGKKGYISEASKDLILTKVKTITELQEAVKAFVKTESTPKLLDNILNSFNYITSLYVSNPIIMGSLSVVGLIGAGFLINYAFGLAAIWGTINVMNEGNKATETQFNLVWTAIRETKNHTKEMVTAFNLNHEYTGAILKALIMNTKRLANNIGVLATNGDKSSVAEAMKVTGFVLKKLHGEIGIDVSVEGFNVFTGVGNQLGGELRFGREASKLVKEAIEEIK